MQTYSPVRSNDSNDFQAVCRPESNSDSISATATAVLFANGIGAQVARKVDWIHLPVPYDRGDDAYFAPLADLRLQPGTRLYLGLIHLRLGAAGTRKLIETAARHRVDFGIATECGFGRRDPATIPELLKLHAALADG